MINIVEAMRKIDAEHGAGHITPSEYAKQLMEVALAKHSELTATYTLTTLQDGVVVGVAENVSRDDIEYMLHCYACGIGQHEEGGCTEEQCSTDALLKDLLEHGKGVSVLHLKDYTEVCVAHLTSQ